MLTSAPSYLSLCLSPRAGIKKAHGHAPSLTCHYSNPSCLSTVSDDLSLTLLFFASLNSSRKGDILSVESGIAKSKVPLPTLFAQGCDHPPRDRSPCLETLSSRGSDRHSRSAESCLSRDSVQEDGEAAERAATAFSSPGAPRAPRSRLSSQGPGVHFTGCSGTPRPVSDSPIRGTLSSRCCFTNLLGTSGQPWGNTTCSGMSSDFLELCREDLHAGERGAGKGHRHLQMTQCIPSSDPHGGCSGAGRPARAIKGKGFGHSLDTEYSPR